MISAERLAKLRIRHATHSAPQYREWCDTCAVFAAYDEQKERIEKLEKWLEDQVLKYRLNPDVATAYTETLARVRAHPRMLKIKGY